MDGTFVWPHLISMLKEKYGQKVPISQITKSQILHRTSTLPQLLWTGKWIYFQVNVFKDKVVYRGSPHFEISQFMISAILWFCFRPIWRKEKKILIFLKLLFIVFFYLFYSDCHLMNFFVKYDNCKKFNKHVDLEMPFK